MVPDASVLIRPVDGRTRVEHERDLDVWLHFDAKYKLDWASAQFDKLRPDVEEQVALEEEDRERVGVSRRDDLLKMHAYRDAIRRSAGAYVLFPGTAGPRQFREYVELIPGLGAFPLRPGDDAGGEALERFVEDVLLHAADQATAEERKRFWQARIFRGPVRAGRPAVGFLDRPPADTQVLISWVSNEPERQWAVATEQCVIQLPQEDRGVEFRAEELAAPLILLAGVADACLFERRGAWTIVDEHDLQVIGHPNPPYGLALLCGLLRVEEQPKWLRDLPLVELVERSPSPGAPVLTSWAELVRADSSPMGRPGMQPPSRLPRPARPSRVVGFPAMDRPPTPAEPEHAED